jgi:RNA polymerase sigma factor (TIGR02999 family)
MDEVPQLLTRIDSGDAAAAEQLLPLVYDELRRLAAALLAGEKPGQTLQATALVHEAYLKLVGNDPSRPWPGKAYFFGAAAEAMRRILVDRARRKSAAKRGGPDFRRQPLDSDLADTAPPAEVIGVHEALDQLQVQDSLAAELVKLHYFGGMQLEDAGKLLGMSRATAYRMWTYARTWLRAYLDESSDSPSAPEKVPESPAN